MVGQSFIPALFGHATEDTFILMHHSEALHAAYAGDKNLIKWAAVVFAWAHLRGGKKCRS